MADAPKPLSKIDQAALLGAALAAIVSISAAEGAWELLESVIGVVLLLIISSFYDFSTARDRSDWYLVKYAVSSVLALIWCLVLAYPIQLVLGFTSWLHIALGVVTFVIFVVQVVLLTRGRSDWSRRTFKRFDSWLGKHVGANDPPVRFDE